MKISKDVQAVVYRRNNTEVKFLLLNRYDKEKEATHYRLIKGGLKESENPEHAVLREISEESGLMNLVIKSKISEYSYKAGDVQHDVGVFLVENTGEEDIKTDSKEEGGFTIEGAEWLNSDNAIQKLNFDHEKESIKVSLNNII